MDDASDPEKKAVHDAHVPWESIDAREGENEADDAGESEEASESEEELAAVDAGVDGATESAEDTEAAIRQVPPSRGGGWTLPTLCAGIALIACCALIPQADANRRLAYERQTLQMDLETVEKQIAVNDSFLKKVGQDPTLAERLAQRQMKVIQQGTRVLELPGDPGGAGGSSMSPFQLVNVAPPAPLPPYKPIGGFIARVCYDAHSRLYLIGISLGMIACGLVLGPGAE